MTVPTERALHLTKDIVLPLGVIIVLVTFSFQFGGWKSEKDIVIANTAQLAAATATEVRGIQSQLIRMDARIDGVAENGKRVEKKLDLLQDFTEGRISRFPYRPSGGH